MSTIKNYHNTVGIVTIKINLVAILKILSWVHFLQTQKAGNKVPNLIFFVSLVVSNLPIMDTLSGTP